MAGKSRPGLFAEIKKIIRDGAQEPLESDQANETPKEDETSVGVSVSENRVLSRGGPIFAFPGRSLFQITSIPKIRQRSRMISRLSP